MMTEGRTRLDALPTIYPRIFSAGSLSWGFEHGDGWCDLIEALCARINTILQDEPDASMAVRQIKEKFGTLRFYYDLHAASDEMVKRIRDAVARAEQTSGQICERCGRSAKIQTDAGWWSTLCPRCRTNST